MPHSPLNKSHGNHSQVLLTSPSAIFGSLIADIQRAHESIDMEYYIFANDRTGHLFSKLLRRKSRQGVRVRLIVDGYGSRSLQRSMRRELQTDGVELMCHTLLRHSRNHRKMTVIDNNIAHIGGVNIADRYIVGNSLGQWHDAQLRVTGGAARAIGRLFNYDYMVSDGLKCETPMLYQRDDVELIWSEAQGGKAISELLRRTVSSARRRVTIVTPYFMPPGSIIRELSDIVARGVKVSIIAPERCDVWILDDIIRSRVADAVGHGIDVRLCRDAFVHAKMAVVDEQSVVIGSANLDARSLNLNREIMAVTFNRGVVAVAQQFIERLLSRATPPTERDMRSYVPRFVGRWFEGLL